jgi:hypothetical protein
MSEQSPALIFAAKESNRAFNALCLAIPSGVHCAYAVLLKIMNVMRAMKKLRVFSRQMAPLVFSQFIIKTGDKMPPRFHIARLVDQALLSSLDSAPWSKIASGGKIGRRPVHLVNDAHFG